MTKLIYTNTHIYKCNDYCILTKDLLYIAICDLFDNTSYIKKLVTRRTFMLIRIKLIYANNDIPQTISKTIRIDHFISKFAYFDSLVTIYEINKKYYKKPIKALGFNFRVYIDDKYIIKDWYGSRLFYKKIRHEYNIIDFH